jgi:hypothetical protein
MSTDRPLPRSFQIFHAPMSTRVLVALVCVLHFVMGGLVGLSVDEAHYALYAAHPALSYFDHPPLVGWVQWPLVVLNAPAFVLRLVPELLWLGAVIVGYGLAEQLSAKAQPSLDVGKAGFWTVLVLALAPLLHVLGIGLLPDTLLLFLTVVLMRLTLVLMDANALRRPMPWLMLGAVLGLAGLSKYTAVLAAVAVAGCLFAAHGWALLRCAWAWSAVLLAVVMVAPVLVWNMQNQWISFTYQAQHGTGGAWSGVVVLRFLLLQMLVYGPLFLWAWVGARRTPTALRSLLLFFGVPFLVLAYMSGGGTSLPHWTAPAWVALAPFAGLGLAHSLQQGGRLQRIGIMGFAALQALGCALLLGLMVTAGVPFLTGTQGQGNSAQPSNPFADLHGWDAAGDKAKLLAAQHGLHSVSVQNWTLASRLGWYARPLPVYVLQDRFDQFDLWAGDLPVGGDTLLVDWSQLTYEVPQGTSGFGQCTLLDSQDVQRLGAKVSTFHFYACKGWSGNPQPRLKGSS